MSGRKFFPSATLGSLIGAALAAFLFSPERWGAGSSAEERIIGMGLLVLAVFAGGFGGLLLGCRLSRTYQVQRSRGWIPALCLTCVLIFGISAVGQALFMYSKEEVVVSASADVVLLLDASGSMESSGYHGARTDAGCQFVESLGEDNRMQAVCFAGKVLDSSSLLDMDAQGKHVLTQFIQGIDSVGTTDFNQPLETAMQTLTQEGRADAGKAVILLTDGEGSLDNDIVSVYKNGDVKVFTIRISSSSNMSTEARALAGLAADTDGFDVQLTPKADGTVDAADMLEAFQEAFQATTDTQVKMSKDLLICSQETTPYQFLIRAIVFVLCAILFGVGYYGQLSAKSALANGVCGMVAAVVVSLLGGVGYGLCAVFFCLLMATAFVWLEVGGGDVYDV